MITFANSQKNKVMSKKLISNMSLAHGITVIHQIILPAAMCIKFVTIVKFMAQHGMNIVVFKRPDGYMHDPSIEEVFSFHGVLGKYFPMYMGCK